MERPTPLVLIALGIEFEGKQAVHKSPLGIPISSPAQPLTQKNPRPTLSRGDGGPIHSAAL